MMQRIALLICLALSLTSLAQTKKKCTIEILYDPGHPANRFKPIEALGAAFDGHWHGDINNIITDSNIRAMKTVGLKPISYRLRTELGGEVWHWNPKGTWSDAAHQQGYWVSDSISDSPIQISNGYFLPRRGNTHDQANDLGYSRIDDGDTTTFWKSNPYVDQHFTNEPDSLHPQWVVLDFGKLVEVNALRILWSDPYALSFTVDYALDIGHDYFEPYQPGLWLSFPKNKFANNHNGEMIARVADHPIKARFIRIQFNQSSHTAPMSSGDIRDQLGFAIKEIKAGLIDDHNVFHDYLHHAADNVQQSVIHVSSTDPWHRASDLDSNTEQAGIDRFFQSGLTNGQPAMLPIGLLYDTPENMLNLLRYVEQHHYPVNELEMGEEPEGQLIHPNDYATLYLQWAKALKNIQPDIHLGGPSFAALAMDKDEDTMSFSERQWTQIFINYLRKHNGLDLFNFFSFEWYPFDKICDPSAPQLAIAPTLMSNALLPFEKNILPPHTPIYATEYGYSAYGGRSEVAIEGALMYADILGQFLTLGGSKAFLYGYEPTYPEQTNNCDWGNNMLFGMDGDGKIIYRTAAYYGMRMITSYWAKPTDSILEIYPTLVRKNSQTTVSAYALHRPNNKWSLIIINKDPKKSVAVDAFIENSKVGKSPLHYPLQCIQYSSLQYRWKSNGSNGYPDKELLPEERTINNYSSVLIPPYSLTILNESN
jgi:hypothetical protein